jgi:hypothetical protein
MTGIELKIAEVLSDVLDDVPDDKLLAAAGELVKHSDELWIDVRERMPYWGDTVLVQGPKGGITIGEVLHKDLTSDGHLWIKTNNGGRRVRYWMPCPERKGERE